MTADPAAPVWAAADGTVTFGFAYDRSIAQTQFATGALMPPRAHLGEDTAAPLAQVGEAVSRPWPEGAAERGQFTLLGRRWTVGLAEEAALELREAVGAGTEAYPAMEYRHEPISVIGPGGVVCNFGVADEEHVADAQRTGALVVRFDGDPLVDLEHAHRLAVELATSRGRDRDRRGNLTRLVILASGD